MTFHEALYAAAPRRLQGLLCAFAFVAFGCNQSGRNDALHEIRIAEPRDHFHRGGYVEMVPPLLLPLRTERNRVEVWLKLPATPPVTTRFQNGQPLLELPPGSSAARVELMAFGTDRETWEFGVADVRATRFEAGGELFSVLRPESQRLDASLVGWSWRRGSQDEQALATERVAVLAGAIARPAFRKHEMDAARRNNACSGCHQHARAANLRPRERGVANRGTDASGSFQIQNILVSHLPLETYFPLEMNLESPFVSFDCGAQEAFVDREGRRVACTDGRVPWGRLDVRAALTAQSEHARRLCTSRKYLYDHLDDPGRKAFRQGFEECGIESSPSM